MTARPPFALTLRPWAFTPWCFLPKATVYIDPYARGDTTNYISFYKQDVQLEDERFKCFVRGIDAEADEPLKSGVVTPEVTNGTTLRTYRLAVAATGEYTNFFRLVGDSDAQAKTRALTAITTTMNRINAIFEREIAVRMSLVPNELDIIFTDPATDGYSNTDNFALLTENHAKLEAVIGAANYDMGHVFGTGGGGLAGFESPCDAGRKGQGQSGLTSPAGDVFDVGIVAHEIGHQFGAQHTFNSEVAGTACDSFNRLATDAYEPASGSSIMAYPGVCGSQNLQRNANDNFHVKSLERMTAFIAGNGEFNHNVCSANTVTGNTVPTISAGANFNIPKNTPFTLTATASDANGDALTYSWEQYDLGPAAPPHSDTDGMARPLFRAFSPTSSPSRTFPSLPYILNNANAPPETYTGTSPTGAICFPVGTPVGTCRTGEVLPSISRTMTFQVTARDNRSGGGAINSATMQAIVNAAAGPFVVTQPNTAVNWTGGTQETILWDVAGTSAAPISAATVHILLSTDGGNTFPIYLAASTANDGMEAITVPNFSTTTARIKVEAVGNIFFDVSGANFSITANGPPPRPTTLANISTRLRVETDDNVLIGGFIITGTQLKKVIVRAIGPSLSLPGKLANPTLELRNSAGGLIEANDDWMQSPNKQAILDSTIPPSDDLESAIVAMLPANNSYTAIVRGVSSGTGIGVVEAYDLDTSVDSRLANISTRGLVQTGDNVLIAGTIVVGQFSQKVIIRAIGPSLSVAGKLANPTLELRDANGALLEANDDWQQSPNQQAIIDSTIPPSDPLESAIVRILAPAPHTAIVRGVNDTTGIAVVEVYALN